MYLKFPNQRSVGFSPRTDLKIQLLWIRRGYAKGWKNIGFVSMEELEFVLLLLLWDQTLYEEVTIWGRYK